MNDKRRAWYEIHILTALVLMVAGWALFQANRKEHLLYVDPFEAEWTARGWPCLSSVEKREGKISTTLKFHPQGAPMPEVRQRLETIISDAKNASSQVHEIQENSGRSLAINVISALAILGLLAVACEVVLRKLKSH